MDKTLLKKIEIDADLSEIGVEDALSKFGADSPRFIICGINDGVEAGRIAQTRNLEVIIFPCVERDSWAIIGEYTVVWSGGA